MIKAAHPTSDGKQGKAIDLTSRERSRSKPVQKRGPSTEESIDEERDENGNFRNWPVAGTVFD